MNSVPQLIQPNAWSPDPEMLPPYTPHLLSEMSFLFEGPETFQPIQSLQFENRVHPQG